MTQADYERVVNGKMVVKDSKFQKVRAGQPIRFPMEEKGRFVPASVKAWSEEFPINVHFDHSPVKPDEAHKH